MSARLFEFEDNIMRRFVSAFLLCTLVLILFLNNVLTVGAQTQGGGLFDDGVVTFLQLGENEISMNGPFDAARVKFGIPATWRLTGGAEIEIFMNVSYGAVGTNDSSTPSVNQNGGSLSVIMNNVVLGVVQLNETGELSVKYQIPVEALISRRDDGLMELDFALESGFDCSFSQSTIVVIHPFSRFTLPHDNIPPDTSLLNFPRPLYSTSFIADSALVVLPDQPTAAELQSALTIGAGLTNLTGSDFKMNLSSVSRLTAEQLKTNHLILVGTPNSFSSLLSELQLPSPVSGNQYQITGLESDDGVVEMIGSPWSQSHVVLLVSGNSDIGVLKSSQAITTGVLRAGPHPNVSVVKNIQSLFAPASMPVDFTLSDLGYSTNIMDSRGSTTFSYDFNVPPGKAVASDAFFELAYGHSALLNYDRSGIIVLLNGQPLGSVKLSAETASQPVNHIKVNMPPSLVQIGVNRIEVVANVVPFDICATIDLNSEWITVWSDSQLHLPLSDTLVASPNAVSDLSEYPAPFINQPTLDTTAFVLQQNDFESWQASFGIASYLGNSASGSIIFLKVFYADRISEAEYPLYNFIFVGRPSGSPFIESINKDLPAPFEANSDIAIEKNMPATFLIPPDAPIGYVELLPSPWNKNNTIVAVVGNTSQGIVWAATAVGDSPLGSRLAGNFVVVNDQQVLTTDTRLVPLSTLNISASTPIPTTVSPAKSPSTLNTYSKNTWIPLALVALAALTFLTLAAVGYSGWINNRTRNKIKNNDKP